MAKGNRLNNRRKTQHREDDSEASDEEYKVTEDEECDESDECYSFDGDESEELADFEVSGRVSRSRNTRRTSTGRKKVNETIKPRKKRRIIYTEDDDDVDDEDDAEHMSLGRKTNQIKKKPRVSDTELDDNYDDDDDAEFVSLGRKRRHTKGSREKKRVVYTDDDDHDADDDVDEDDDGEDDTEFVSLGRKRRHAKNDREKKRVVYTDDDDVDDDDDDDVNDHDEDDDGEDDTELMSLGRKANQIKKPAERKRGSNTKLDDDDDDYAEFASSGRKINPRKNTYENKRVVYTEDDDDDGDDDDDDFMYLGRKANQKKNLREKRKVSYMENDNEEDDYEFLSTRKKENQMKEPEEKTNVSYKEDNPEDDEDEKDAKFKLSESEFVDDEDDSEFISTNRDQIEEFREKRMVSYKEDNPEDDEDEKDAEFKLSESDFVDDDAETPETKKTEKRIVQRGRKKTKKSKSKTKNPTKSKQGNQWFNPKLDKKRIDNRNKNTSKRRKLRVSPESDSDFVNSASSDHEYTISEEEREQMREARVYCANLRAKLRSSKTGNQEQSTFEQRKYPVRKGKEKIGEIKEIKDELGKQVCGICLSEEGKRTVRGVLNSCQHYFCFSCILEWSKVESRCPLCKQRFATITKSAKSDSVFDLRTVVIPVPECDQVYQPSEEEVRGYLDPYESVICSECQNGGDDALMLLCDICDSSAHTFCVGLGREVPEGNWYCEGCRPTVFGTPNSQQQSDRRLNNNNNNINQSDLLPSPVAVTVGGGFDLNELYVPETPLTQQQTRVLPEPIMPTANVATTLRDRRRIHRQIHHRFLNNNRISSPPSSSSGIRLFGSQLDQARVSNSIPQNDYIMPLMNDDSGFFSPRDQFGVELQSSNADVALQDEFHGSSLGFGSGLGFGHNRSSIGSDSCPSPFACRDVIGPSRTSQGGLHAP